MAEESKTFEERFDMLMQSFEESNKAAEKRTAEWEKRIAEYEKAAEKRIAEYEKAAEKRAAEYEQRAAEYEKAREKSNAEFDKRMEKIQSNIGGISESNGDMAEEMIYNSLEQDMVFAGIEFYEITANMRRKSKSQDLVGEYDIVLTNGDTLAIIETKYKVRSKDVTKLVGENVEKFRKLFSEFNGYKIVLGIGGMSFEDKAIEQAQQNGVGIIKIFGDKVEFHTDEIRIY